MGGDDVAGIFGEFVLSQRAHDLIDRRGRHGQQQGATDEFEESVEAFEDDADLEGPVEEVLGPEPAHSWPPSLRRPVWQAKMSTSRNSMVQGPRGRRR